MNKIISLSMFVLVASMITSGMVDSAFAQNDPSILLKIAHNAQTQIYYQINDKTPDNIKKLFEDGSMQVTALDESLQQKDLDSAKKHFLLAMKTFKQVSKQLNQLENITQKSVKIQIINPNNDLLKIQKFVSKLKTIAEKHSPSISFLEIDKLLLVAKDQINSQQFIEAQKTIDKSKQLVKNTVKILQNEISEQKTIRIQTFAQKYLEKLDKLIEHLKDVQVTQEIIQKLEILRDDLSQASSSQEIIKEIKNIQSVKKEFHLFGNHDKMNHEKHDEKDDELESST